MATTGRLALAFGVCLAGCGSGSQSPDGGPVGPGLDGSGPLPGSDASMPGADTGSPSAAGTATGPAVTATIGAGGGSLKSADGLFELVVPPGALAADTALRLTPITNEAPLGVFSGLRLEPAGTMFSQPAKLVLHHGQEIPGTSPELLLVATRDPAGYWVAAGAVTLDAAAHTVTGQVSHFSDWSFAACGKLDIDNYVVSPGVPAHLAVVEQCDTPAAMTGRLPGGAPTTRPVDWRKSDRMGAAGPGTLTPMGPAATLEGPAAAPADPMVVVRASYTTSTGASRVYQDTIAVASMVSFNIDGHDVIVSTSPFVMTLGGKSVVAAAAMNGSVSVGFAGAGVGGFSSNPDQDIAVNATTGLDPMTTYVDTYIVPCTNTIKALTTQVSVSHANRDRQFIRGSFQGTLSITRGMVRCNNSDVPNVVEVQLQGTFVTRWLAY
jgi:hypothetical protein